jgi:drug/metabolite transporter (DMT)-like permease
MSQFWVGNLFLLLSLLFGSGSQVVLKACFNETGPLRLDFSFWERFLVFRIFVLFVLALAMLVAGFLFWLMSLSRLDLSYAYPIACSSALLVAAFSALFLGEAVTANMWGGAALIVLGTALLIPSS